MKTIERVDRQFHCSGTRFKAHACSGPIELHHVFYRKVHCRTEKQRQYAGDEINLAPVCQAFHAAEANSREFRHWWYLHQKGAFGAMAMDNYLSGWPGKIKERAP